MTISNFNELLDAAKKQPEPQRLLFVFSVAELPDDSTEAQRQAFATGQGGALVPVMCADKLPGEIGGIVDLVAESNQFERDWTVVFAASLGGRGTRAPTSHEAEEPLQRMVAQIKAGQLGGFIPFNRAGDTVALG